ncbi:MAG: TOBE domain-containing protein, partial [Betaproteobacteria bacterium]|nr:TOBE domain-containing protein [Betaproteobacteria bacterium]
ATIRNPAVFLMDEPLSNLDAILRVQMRDELLRLHERLQTTMIYVTHDQVEAMTLADRIVVLQAGRIEQVGSPLELYEHPDNVFVAGFIGSPRMNFIDAEVVEASATGALVRLATGALIRCAVEATAQRPGDKVILGVRPEHFQVNPEANDPAYSLLSATVTFVERLGGTTHAYCVFPGVEDALTCELSGQVRIQSGDTVSLGVAASACYLFNAEGRALRRLAAQMQQEAA